MQKPHPLITELVELDTLKTWSLIVTLFGDLGGKELSGKQIRDLLGRIGIKPEAIRVALHRLKSEGWVTSQKQGREAIYKLSQQAWVETNVAAPNVYCKRTLCADHWCFVLFQTPPKSEEAILINKNLALIPKKTLAAENSGFLLLPTDSTFPDWVSSTFVLDKTLRLARGLVSLLVRYDELADADDRVVFRLLALHHWRRIVLRNGSLAHASLATDGPIALCHQKMATFLNDPEVPKLKI